MAKLGGLTLKQRMIAKFGSEDAYKAHMSEIAKRPRPNSKGGSFRDKKFAAEQGTRGGKISRRKLV